MPEPSGRIMPARSMSWCEGTTASLGTLRAVGMRVLDQWVGIVMG